MEKITGYKIVKYCRICSKRYVVQKEEARKCYCDKCHEKIMRSEEKNERKSKIL